MAAEPTATRYVFAPHGSSTQPTMVSGDSLSLSCEARLALSPRLHVQPQSCAYQHQQSPQLHTAQPGTRAAVFCRSQSPGSVRSPPHVGSRTVSPVCQSGPHSVTALRWSPPSMNTVSAQVEPTIHTARSARSPSRMAVPRCSGPRGGSPPRIIRSISPQRYQVAGGHPHLDPGTPLLQARDVLPSEPHSFVVSPANVSAASFVSPPNLAWPYDSSFVSPPSGARPSSRPVTVRPCKDGIQAALQRIQAIQAFRDSRDSAAADSSGLRTPSMPATSNTNRPLKKTSTRESLEESSRGVVQLANLLQNVVTEVNSLRSEQGQLQNRLDARLESLLSARPQLESLCSGLTELEDLEDVASPLGSEVLTPSESNKLGDGHCTDSLAVTMQSSQQTCSTWTPTSVPKDVSFGFSHYVPELDAMSDAAQSAAAETSASLRELLNRHDPDPHVALAQAKGADNWRKLRMDMWSALALSEPLRRRRRSRIVDTPQTPEDSSPERLDLTRGTTGEIGWSKVRAVASARSHLVNLLKETRSKQLDQLYTMSGSQDEAESVRIAQENAPAPPDDVAQENAYLEFGLPRKMSSESMLSPSVNRRRPLAKLSLSKVQKFRERPASLDAPKKQAVQQKHLVMPWGGSGVGATNLERTVSAPWKELAHPSKGE